MNADSAQRRFWSGDRAAAAFLLALAAGTAWAGRKLPLGSLRDPGPAAWPLLLAALLALLGAAIFLGRREGAPPVLPGRDEARRALAIFGAAIFIAATLETLGFRLTILAASLFLIGVVEKRPALPTLLVSFALSFGLHVLFAKLLKVPLPIGLLGL